MRKSSKLPGRGNGFRYLQRKGLREDDDSRSHGKGVAILSSGKEQ
jgi:hypothetical protein